MLLWLARFSRRASPAMSRELRSSSVAVSFGITNSGSGANHAWRGFARGRSRTRRAQKRLCIFADVAVRENRVAGDKNLSACANDIADRIESHSAIDFDSEF